MESSFFVFYIYKRRIIRKSTAIAYLLVQVCHPFFFFEIEDTSSEISLLPFGERERDPKKERKRERRRLKSSQIHGALRPPPTGNIHDESRRDERSVVDNSVGLETNADQSRPTRREKTRTIESFSSVAAFYASNSLRNKWKRFKNENLPRHFYVSKNT